MIAELKWSRPTQESVRGAGQQRKRQIFQYNLCIFTGLETHCLNSMAYQRDRQGREKDKWEWMNPPQESKEML
jgi:hypothetical protein